ncbi:MULTISPECIES: cation diffusion facilitator family transporter [unclassified Roseovarius]|uniref:cation diffusion facilitator family transporter n=1 Tax=unclassified Roseovarius TaxID=2614913 RepID=UPI00273F5323|nr:MULTISPECIES: cation diffusion facilitator family transporter [unclassified Roseovarius]
MESAQDQWPNGSSEKAQQSASRFRVGIAARIVLSLLLGIGGIAAGSITLLADALNNLSIVLPKIAFSAAMKISQPQVDERFAENYLRIETAATLIGYIAVTFIGAYLFYEGTERFFRTVKPNGLLIVILGGLSATANFAITLFAFENKSPRRWPSSSSLICLAIPIAVFGTGISLMLYQSPILDPMIGVIIVVCITWMSIKSQIHAIRTFTNGHPDALVPGEVIKRVLAVEGVVDTHHVHFWQVGRHKTAMDAHVVVNSSDWSNAEAIRDRIEAVLVLHCGITHITLEMEVPSREEDEMNIYGK